MKKIFLALILVFGLGFSSSAQSTEKKLDGTQKQDALVVKTLENAEPDAKTDAKELGILVALDEANVQAFYQLLLMKNMVVYDSEMSDVRKSIMRTSVAAKIRATLSDSQMKQLEKNNQLLTRLIN